MNWEKEIKFQRDQMVAMLPGKEDLILLGVSAIITLSLLACYCCFGLIVTEVAKMF